MKYLITCGISLSLLTGCSQPPPVIPPIVTEALFCDMVTEPFQWTQADWDEWVEKYPANTRRAVEINLSLDAECAD